MQLISSAPVLGTFDPNKKIIIQCDSSKDGIGCCLMCGNQPVPFASRSLTEAEKIILDVKKKHSCNLPKYTHHYANTQSTSFGSQGLHPEA